MPNCRSCPGGNRCRCRDPVLALSEEYRKLTGKRWYHEQLELFEMKKLSDIFDMADEALSGVESVLKPAEPASEKQGSYIIDVKQASYAETWKEAYWAVVLKGKTGEGHHMFLEGSGTPDGFVAICGAKYRSEDVEGRIKLEHGQRRVFCTSCVIRISQHG